MIESSGIITALLNDDLDALQQIEQNSSRIPSLLMAFHAQKWRYHGSAFNILLAKSATHSYLANHIRYMISECNLEQYGVQREYLRRHIDIPRSDPDLLHLTRGSLYLFSTQEAPDTSDRDAILWYVHQYDVSAKHAVLMNRLYREFGHICTFAKHFVLAAPKSYWQLSERDLALRFCKWLLNCDSAPPRLYPLVILYSLNRQQATLEESRFIDLIAALPLAKRQQAVYGLAFKIVDPLIRYAEMPQVRRIVGHQSFSVEEWSNTHDTRITLAFHQLMQDFHPEQLSIMYRSCNYQVARDVDLRLLPSLLRHHAAIEQSTSLDALCAYQQSINAGVFSSFATELADFYLDPVVHIADIYYTTFISMPPPLPRTDEEDLYWIYFMIINVSDGIYAIMPGNGPIQRFFKIASCLPLIMQQELVETLVPQAKLTSTGFNRFVDRYQFFAFF